MRTSLALLLLSLVPCLATSRKDHYRFRDDMPADEDDDHNNGYSNSILSLSRCRHNYHERTEAGMNRQINFFMHAGYVYNSMAHYFGRCDVALPGFQKFFQQLTQEQRERSETLMNYQNLRGGFITLQPVTAPSNSEWGSGRDAMIQALDLEKSVNQALLELHMVALQHEDVHAATYIQTAFLNPQVEKIFTISQYITNLERVGSGLGEYMFDKLPQN
ncbi:soma ferritin-like isoform X1 [Homarus americanus]|uniref:soma ferritin-like isoform X1 n=1 Tax=Homarus americanus TaxID=6706 RepID=UPI001C47C23B|nr:soma ferritin-like isoform X1 [Homarus americanus]XP_042212275.1 soma ferritin-like isoform X1 [Homarus americanus]